MTPKIETLPEKKLIGKSLTMSLANNRTVELWKSFMARRNGISNNLTNDLISMQVYPANYYSDFNPAAEFQKWAAVEVSDFESVPDGLEKFVLPAGLYAVFAYKGSSNDPSIFQYIFGTWLPTSEYVLDDRPHFEVLGAKYRNNDPISEEEICIPVKGR
ncbi:MAG: GyrI-like domain-containing protein [Bacteroidota bacterium]|nr:GyrI-like domain-containing protein [Bacteroidota bacterium]